ncbi:uncharacterized protein LOC8259310 [Ricinus communis]|uniref:Uncharacterized protein n=1 Tax=Ricinus communis TaxID=3988 RepID=B9RVN8_RICCO|nr:uncharacterized protein LOC8259310 [Ricinus communis]EEF44614.1 conserved hypothetical protein [Ricinus communis]|eukprot:XP_002517807.1 uncharacterized protein LOC8259310 [Ricinus communis]
MAALSLSHFLHNKNSSVQLLKTRSNPRIIVHLSCQRDEPIDSSSPKVKEEMKQEKQVMVRQLFVSAEKFAKGVKDNLSPKQKGDWKDVVLMSLSFAVYVYISQQIVCAYCAWTSMLKQPW